MTRNQVSLELAKILKQIDKLNERVRQLMEGNDRAMQDEKKKAKRLKKGSKKQRRAISGNALPAPEAPLLPTKGAVIASGLSRLRRPL